MKLVLPPEQRLIVAADFEPVGPNGCAFVKTQVLALADNLKVNFVLRACGL